MEKNWLIIILVIAAVIVIIVLLIIRNQKDEKALKEKIIAEDGISNQAEHDKEVDTED